MALGSTISQVTESGIKPGITWPSFVSSGIATATNFKTGTSNVHSTGIEVAGINVNGGDVNIGSGATVYDDGSIRSTGIVTASSFFGNVTGDLAGNISGLRTLGTGVTVTAAGIISATSYYGDVTGNISGGTVAGSTGTFSSNVTISGNLGVAGTITYEDVARVDATGVSTFREGFGVGPLAGIALTAYKDGSIRTSGIVTATTFVGNVTGNVTGNISGGTVAGSTGTFTGNVTCSGKVHITDDLDAGQLLVGTSTSDATTKYGTFNVPHKTNSEEPVMVIGGESTTSNSQNIYVGGGFSTQNACKQILFYTAADTTTVTGTERMRIDSSGNVTKPTNFWINVRRSGNQTGYNANNTTDVIVWNNIQNGSTGHASHFDTSTGLFTAPVTGMYHFHVAVNCNFDVEGSWLVVNGSRAYWSAFYPNNTASADGSIFYPITAGQTVGTKWYKNNSSSTTINANDHHTWWRIVLLG